MFKLKVVHLTLSAIIFAFLLLFLNNCSDDNPASPDTTLKFPFYSVDLTMQHSQSPLKLSDFMTEKHLDYHQFGWNICASLVDNNNDTAGFFIALEYAVGTGYRGGVGYSLTENAGYNWAGFISSSMQTTTNPWSATLINPADATQYITIQLTSGLMGSPNAVYKLTADVVDLNGKKLKVSVRLQDQFGAMNQGYGTTSFFPHYLTEVQRTKIMALPKRTIDEYVESNKDSMSWQGAYYYALPLMNVEQFSIEHDSTTLIGSKGKSWMDYFVKSYNAESIQKQAGAKWDWIAIQLPEINSAINVLNISSDVTGNLPFARLFNNNSAITQNGAKKAAFSWGIDAVKVERIGDEWQSPSGQKYSMKYRITLESAINPAELTVTMLRKNQAVVLPEGSNYQGLGIVEGTLGGQAVHGQCWVEVQPVGL